MAEHTHHHTPAERGRRMLKESGYSARKDGGSIHEDAAQDEKLDKKISAKDVHRHESELHPGKPKTKLRTGGHVPGKDAKMRPDRRARGGHITEDQPDDDMGNDVKDSGRARGGAMKRADGGRVSKKGAKTIININAGGGDPQQAEHEQMAKQAGIQQGAQLGAKMAAAKMGGGPPGPPPPGAMGPPRPPMPGPGGPPPPGMMPQRPPGV